MSQQKQIDTLLAETRTFEPPPEFAAAAHISSMDQYRQMYRRSIEERDNFWTEVASELTWFKQWDKVFQRDAHRFQWFAGGKTNVCYNCLDRHLTGPFKNKAALVWEGEDGAERVLRYHDLYREVCRFANGLKQLGVQKGDRVGLYMPLVPELAIAMLACARLGAIHSVVFGGFSAEAVRDRMVDAEAKVLITADGGLRRGAVVQLKANVDAAVAGAPSIEKVIVVRRLGNEVEWNDQKDIWWHDLVDGQSLDCPPAEVDAEDPLYILYTSGTTGKPKGVLHTTGGYMVGCYLSTKYVFDLRDDDTFWCSADVGWVTGHSYVVYGPLLNGATSLMFEGALNWPEPDRIWAIIEKYAVNILYTAPTAIRSFIRAGDQWPQKHDLASLRLLGTVGEPINPEAWMWYHEVIGSGRCPVVDSWWQTETGSIMITPLPGAIPTKPGSCTLPFFGVEADVVDAEGKSVAPGGGGFVVLKNPPPSMARTLYGDDERYQREYWSRFEKQGYYFAGDGGRRDADGYFWVLGRIDDVINKAGHRLGTMEIESAIVSHPTVAEAAVVGRPDDLVGTAIVAFVTLKAGQEASDEAGELLRDQVVKEIGAIARPDEIRFADALPKTRSGKIMRRLLRDIAAGEKQTGDTTTLEDLTVLAALRGDEEE
ncbi:MAG TPA: acetate--CoA ligase [Dehalococcoidia bacterium]|nr:acetate--CoA ligase [Dehalococcoidia bacterium]